MTDSMNELVQHSPYEGELFLQPVSGDISGRREAENDAAAGFGAARTMYAYAPKSGCPHPKQCQVLMVLRNGGDRASAERLMKEWGLDALAEEKNFLLLFPNPAGEGWNFQNDPARENDMDYLIRCFGVLKGSELGVSGFNGMVFYLAASPEASALLMTMSALKPLNVPAMMIGPFPKGYTIPQEALHVETSAFVSKNPAAAGYLMDANGRGGPEHAGHSGQMPEQVIPPDQIITYRGANSNVRLLVTGRDIDAETICIAWDRLFSETRRWQNDTYGCYQERTNFAERGFVGHVKDASLGCNNGFSHTWYEYVPPKLRGTGEKVPLLFYFHGGGCVPLYGAEQSGWHDVADREDFIVVYPEASQDHRWNVWNDLDGGRLCSDRDFFLALIEHMKAVHPIDETRIYVSGFSMGGMMSNAMACALPNIVAAAAPCNAFNEGYFSSFKAFMSRIQGNSYDPAGGMENGADGSVEQSKTRREADARKAAYDYRMPVIQTAGLLDGAWPIVRAEDARLKTFDYWRTYNHIHTEPFVQDVLSESGVTADETFYEGDDGRFLCHRWFTEDAGHAPLYQLLLVKRCPHALDIRTAGIVWEFLKRFARNGDGSLKPVTR